MFSVGLVVKETKRKVFHETINRNREIALVSDNGAYHPISDQRRYKRDSALTKFEKER